MTRPRRPRFEVTWNGGRNRHAAFLVGFGWTPRNDWGVPWLLQVYLGLWALRMSGRRR